MDVTVSVLLDDIGYVPQNREEMEVLSILFAHREEQLTIDTS